MCEILTLQRYASRQFVDEEGTVTIVSVDMLIIDFLSFACCWFLSQGKGWKGKVIFCRAPREQHLRHVLQPVLAACAAAFSQTHLQCVT